MKRIYIVLGIVALVVAIMFVQRGSGGGSVARAPVPVEGLEDQERLLELAQGITAGDEDVPITIVEFGDYQCPACGAFFTAVKPRIDQTYVETGLAKFAFYDFPIPALHPNAFLAARAARCAGDQGRYWDYHDMLFGNQTAWSASTDPSGMFVGYAGRLGMAEDDFEDCLMSDAHAVTVTANMRFGEALGVGGTPTVFVSTGDGAVQTVSGNTFEALAQIIDALIAGTAGGGAQPPDSAGGGGGGGAGR